MKKTTYPTILIVTLIVIVFTTTGCQPGTNGTSQNAKLDLSQLPADLVIPATLPTTIQDPLLLEGWIYLYNRKETIQLWNGATISGQQLAQYVLDNAVVITWAEGSGQGGSSWVDRGGTGVVYITPGIKDLSDEQMTRLVGTLAHELFHRTTPFGQLETTLYEEYWAFYVGMHVSGNVWADFDHFNPLSVNSLNLWFKTHNISAYLDTLQPYPTNVTALASN